MTDRSGMPIVRSRGAAELVLVVLGYSALTVFLTWPLASQLGTAARLDNTDTQRLIWNVAWVARTLIVDPFEVFHANIFYPHRWTLAYTESNLGAGALAIPAYWATRNPYAAYNVVVCLSFVLSAVGAYYLVRYLVGHRFAAAIAAVCFAYCPYVFSHIPQVHLLMGAGLPWSMLAFHRLADRPTWRRGVTLGVVGALQAFFCGYYAVFVGLTVGYALLVVVVTRRLWGNARYWGALLVAAAVAACLALPLFLPYRTLQLNTGFARPIEDARLWSATWRTYFASSAWAHGWMLRLIERWNEVLFPGFVALIAGVSGLVVGWRRGGRFREVTLLYGGLAFLACWASFGPDAGLYAGLHAAAPAVFSFMRAPSRFGLVVVFALSVLSGVSLSALLAWLGGPQRARSGSVEGRGALARRRVALAGVVLLSVAVLELKVPLAFATAPPFEHAYRVLATLPPGPVLEMPFFSARFASSRAQYMLNSTVHWMPLVNGHSDYTPDDFFEKTDVLAGFPSLESFAMLERDQVRYAVFHMDFFSPAVRQDVIARLETFDRFLARRYVDPRVWLYEIVAFPQ